MRRIAFAVAATIILGALPQCVDDKIYGTGQGWKIQ